MPPTNGPPTGIPHSGTPYMNGGSPTNAPPPQSNPAKSGTGSLTNPGASEVLGDINPESVPANMKVEGQDWFAL